jgi:hypothetical protein
VKLPATTRFRITFFAAIGQPFADGIPERPDFLAQLVIRQLSLITRGECMRRMKFLALTAIAGLVIAASAPRTQAQVSIGIGVAPACPYGYFETPPYGCAPYGYYGPEWFSNGVFIGAGPWFHGPENFHGYVDNRYRTDHGYHGEYPHHGDRPRDGWHGSPEHFHGNEWRDGHGHAHEDGHR